MPMINRNTSVSKKKVVYRYNVEDYKHLQGYEMGHVLPCSLQLFNLNIHYKDQSFKSKRPSKRCA